MAKKKSTEPTTPTNGEQKKGARADTEIVKTKKLLLIRLTEAEVLCRFDEADILRDRVKDEEDALDKVKEQSKLRVKEIQSTIDRLSKEARQRGSYADVECETRYFFSRPWKDNAATRTVEVWRTDTNEMIEERGMTQTELQLGLNFEAKSKGTVVSPDEADAEDLLNAEAEAKKGNATIGDAARTKTPKSNKSKKDKDADDSAVVDDDYRGKGSDKTDEDDLNAVPVE